MKTPKHDTAPKSYGPEPDPSPGWHVVPDIGDHDHLRQAFESGNGYALVVATVDRGGYVLPAWMAEAWRDLREKVMAGKMTWNEALAPQAADGHKVTVREHKAYVKNMMAIHRYRQHRWHVASRRERGKQVDDPLEGLPKDSSQFKGALGKVMELTPAAALHVYNTILPKAERYPHKRRKKAVRRGS